MVNLVPQNGERIIISTIAIDWEFHENLLINIITYITEGVPKVAFIDNVGKRHDDFDFLLTSVKLSKISHVIYDDISKIRKDLWNVHNIYIFSPDWKENEIINFLNNFKLDIQNNNVRNKSYIRVYYFKQIENILTLTQYSNFSTIDLIIDSSVLWINSMFNGCMWGNSFWITYDILSMMTDIGFDVETYLTPIFKDIKKHYSDFSYDGVIGATCGLLELILQLDNKYESGLIKENFTEKDFKGIFNWIIDKYDSLSIYDKQTAILTLNKCYNRILQESEQNIKDSKYIEIINHICNKLDNDDLLITNYSEIEICRNLSINLACNNKDVKINELLANLKNYQSLSGKWTNIGRTAHVLIFLLKNISELKNCVDININIDDMIYNGILFLRSEYNWKLANWDDDIQASAKSIHAIGLYNDYYKYSTQDFFKTLEIEGDKIYSATVIHNVSESIRKLRQQSNEMLLKIDEYIEREKKQQKDLSELKQTIDDYEYFESKNVKEYKKGKLVSAISLTVLIALVLYMAIKHPQDVWKEFSQFDIITLIIGLVGGFIFPFIFMKPFSKRELMLKNNNRKKEKTND